MKAVTDRVQQAARRALGKHADFDKALAAFERAVANDAEALREILAPYWRGAASVLLRREAAMIRSAAGHQIRAADGPVGGQVYGETQNEAAPGRSTHARRASAKAAAALSIFDSFVTELGRPLGDVSKEELMGLRDRNATRSALYDFLQHPLPPHGVVREHFKEGEVLNWMRRETPQLLPRAAA